MRSKRSFSLVGHVVRDHSPKRRSPSSVVAVKPICCTIAVPCVP